MTVMSYVGTTKISAFTGNCTHLRQYSLQACYSNVCYPSVESMLKVMQCKCSSEVEKLIMNLILVRIF
jgi:hypothetical protein